MQSQYFGILSCSGEEYPGGTVSRIASLTVMQKFLPLETTTICVPLFLTGEQQELDFVKKYPCITIDGCSKRCVARSLENLNIKPLKEFLVPDFFSKEEHEQIVNGHLHDLKWKDHPLCKKLAEAIASVVNEELDKLDNK